MARGRWVYVATTPPHTACAMWLVYTAGNYANRIMVVVTQHRATVGGWSVVTGWMRTGTVERN